MPALAMRCFRLWPQSGIWQGTTAGAAPSGMRAHLPDKCLVGTNCGATISAWM